MLVDLLKQFPALWVLVGGLFMGVIVYALAHRVIALSGAAQAKLIGILQESVKTLEKERDDYRKQSHDYRNNTQALELKLKEMESRPDLSRLFESQRDEANRRYEIYTQQTELIARQTEVLGGVAEMQRKLVTDFETHEKNNAERQSSITSLLQKMVSQSKRRRTT